MTQRNEFIPWQREWIKALRSKNFQQGRGLLFDRGEYCCLGVATHLVKPEYLGNWGGGLMPAEAAEAMQLCDLLGRFKGGTRVEGARSLASLNDEARWDFDQIADLLEQCPELVFNNFDYPQK